MHIAIIGNGVSGVTAARWLRKLSDHKITLISAESDYFFSRTALMYIYMGHMRLKDTQPYEIDFWVKNRIDRFKGYVQTVDFEQKTLQFSDKTKMSYDKLIIASGSTSNKFGWPGQDLDGVHGLYSLQDLEAMESHSPGLDRAVIVGGGLIGIEMAEMFHSRQIPITMLVRESSYWSNILPSEESEIVNQQIRLNHIDLRLSSELKEIVDDGKGKVKAIITKDGETIPCGFVGLTAGVHPNIGFLKESKLEVQKGILINENLQTNIPDVYAIGDCAQLRNPNPGRRPIEAIWYTGRMMGEVAAYNITGQPIKYDPGIWFNSAKFFDVEYQVYGNVPSNETDGLEQIIWVDKDQKKSIRIVFDQVTKSVVGFNLMGVRFRHEVCEKWIKNKTSLKEVLQNIKLANFDPEFYTKFGTKIIDVYNQQFNDSIKMKSHRLNSVLQFLKSN